MMISEKHAHILQNEPAYQRYLQWLNDSYFDAATQAELRGIENRPEAILDRFGSSLSFGTGGLRGLIGAGTNRINVYTVAQATEGLADYLLEQFAGTCDQGVVISYDSRLFSAYFADIAAGILCRRGIPVRLAGSLHPVPVLSFAIRHFRAAAGIMITASHNPAAYNGYKVYGMDGGQITLAAAWAIQTAIRKIDDLRNLCWLSVTQALETGLLTFWGKDVDRAYCDYLLANRIMPEQAGLLAGLKIVYTPLHGTGAELIPEILHLAGCRQVMVVAEQSGPDSFFSTVRVPNPENPDALQLAARLAVKQKADLALGTDPDSDRIGVLARSDDGDLHPLTGNQIGLLLMEFILRNRARQNRLPAGSFCVTTLVSTKLARLIAQAYQIELQETLTGFKFIGERIRRYDEEGGQTFIFGFEESFGYLAGTAVRDKDAIQAALLIAEMAAEAKEQGETLIRRLNRLYRQYGYAAEDTLSFEWAGLTGLQNIQSVMDGLRGQNFQKCGSLLNGVPIIRFRDFLLSDEAATGFPPADVLFWEMGGPLNCDWICARPSGTEPKLKVYCGAYDHDPSAAKARLELFKNGINDLVDHLQDLNR
ncbi:MAG: phospho-sugar mutase [Clostridiaceae bacterium]|nr:phospho-sugar mutase [Clostridiaceae bacterium]